MSIQKQCAKARHASLALALLEASVKNRVLADLKKGLLKGQKAILAANEKDLKKAEKKGLGTLIDRIRLDKERIGSMADSLTDLIKLPDPVGQSIEKKVRPNGLKMERVRVPIGVIGMIYEARPNVTIDAATLCLKSGNAVILKGGSDAVHTNRLLTALIKEALKKNGISEEAVQFIDRTDKKAVMELLSCQKDIDCLVPRGGRNLIDLVRTHAKIPVIETGASVVHTYVDVDADLKKAVAIVVNAKTRRCAICNTLDAVLIHQKVASEFLPQLAEALSQKARGAICPLVEIRADQKALLHLKGYKKLRPAKSGDFGKEFLDYILAVKIVNGLDEALQHIYQYSLGHSEAIVTENQKTAERFLKEVDAACVYVNASTQFSDGGEFGLGAEIGISTQKLHVRGPFALEGLTSYKWVIRGNGQIRT